MTKIKRKFYGDGRWEPVYPPMQVPPESEGLDRIPARSLPEDISTVFFGGGWYALSHFKRNTGYVDGHIVFVSPFYISLRPVSIASWKAVMGSYEHRNFRDGDNEEWAAYVTWENAIKYCDKRSKLEGLEPCYDSDPWNVVCDWNANGYRLPSEAEFWYATPNFKRRLPAKPNPFPRKVDMNDYNIPFIDAGPFYLKGAGASTMVWDRYDQRYFRESPIYDPTGPSGGAFHSARRVLNLPWASNNNLKPYRYPICHHDTCQFYVARSRIFEYNLHHTNLLNRIPQWDL